MLRIRVKLFSIYTDVIGDAIIDLEEGSTLEDLISKLLTTYPELREIFEKFKPAVLINGLAGDPSATLKDGDEVAFIPPTSGG